MRLQSRDFRYATVPSFPFPIIHAHSIGVPCVYDMCIDGNWKLPIYQHIQIANENEPWLSKNHFFFCQYKLLPKINFEGIWCLSPIGNIHLYLRMLFAFAFENGLFFIRNSANWRAFGIRYWNRIEYIFAYLALLLSVSAHTHTDTAPAVKILITANGGNLNEQARIVLWW